MRKKMLRTPRKRPGRRERLGLFQGLGLTGLSRAAESHIEELAYESLKDPKYQEWMLRWLDGFLSALAEDFRAQAEALARAAASGRKR